MDFKESLICGATGVGEGDFMIPAPWVMAFMDFIDFKPRWRSVWSALSTPPVSLHSSISHVHFSRHVLDMAGSAGRGSHWKLPRTEMGAETAAESEDVVKESELDAGGTGPESSVSKARMLSLG